LHEQNSIAGMANKVLTRVAKRLFTAFPGVMPQAEWVGNPMREGFVNQPTPAERFAQRSGPLRVLVVGGSLGAQALNTLMPQALALIPVSQRPQVIHQSGAQQIDALRAAYANVGVHAELTPFIDDTAQAFADADLVIARAGASTVTELAAVGVAAMYVPFPHAVDDHQTTNARFLVDAGGGWLIAQSQLTPKDLANRLQFLTRRTLLACAEKAYAMRKVEAAQAVAAACDALTEPRGAA
jgi:UDP-N-acetylglucosamine--N-acetylmuramyl-(pentapeptide) pyrophosphoryl-undecaprenol N-acetylglucosamine transferase